MLEEKPENESRGKVLIHLHDSRYTSNLYRFSSSRSRSQMDTLHISSNPYSLGILLEAKDYTKGVIE